MSRNLEFQHLQRQNKFHILYSICSDCNKTNCTDDSHKLCISQESQVENEPQVETKTLKDSPLNRSKCTLNIRNDQHNHQCLTSGDTNKDPINSNLNMSNAKSEFNFKRRGIHIVNLNIRHLKPKLDEIKLLLDRSNEVDIFGVCETFLNKSVGNDILHIGGYHFERKDRDELVSTTAEKGGGIIVYIGDHINYTRRHDLEDHYIESVWIEIKLKNCKSFLICSVYRPPSSKSEWIDHFSKQLDKSTSICDEVYIMGDINIDI